MAAALIPCAPGSSFVTLSFSSPQKQLTVDRAVLWHASTVLRAMFEDTCSSGSGGGGGSSKVDSSSCGGGGRTSRGGGGGGGGGISCSSPSAVLQLSGDCPEDWEVALRLLQAKGEILELVTWDNVVPLCRLADKYDIAHLRSYCAWFLSANVSKLTLTAPLASPQNLLHAASLVERYLHQVPHSTQAVQRQLDAFIGCLTPSPSTYSSPLHAVWARQNLVPARQLAQLAASAEYPDIVAPELQKRMHAAMVAALTTVLTYCTV